MDLKAEQRKEELARETKKLEGIKDMIVETVEKTKKLESEYLEEKNKYNKNLINLKNLQESQEMRRNKLDADLSVMDQRQVNIEMVQDINFRLRNELNDLTQNFTNYDEKIEELEQEIKNAYLEWETYKENQVMIEVGMEFTRLEDRQPHLNLLAQQKWETVKLRQLELNREMARIDQEIGSVEAQVFEQQAHLKKLMEDEATLTKALAAVKETVLNC